jgi:hypothetical protein
MINGNRSERRISHTAARSVVTFVTEFGASAAPAHTSAATAFSLKCRKRHLGDKLLSGVIQSCLARLSDLG